MSVRVSQASLRYGPDGVPHSETYGDIYHPREGGLEQSRHVFLAGNRLPERWRNRDAFVILETGFGLGLNFLAAWHAARADPLRPGRLHFVSVENEPFGREDLARALAPWSELAPLAAALVSNCPPPLSGFHRIHFDAGQVILTLLLGDARELLPQLLGRVDAFFLDGFAPAKNPGIWSPETVRELARLAAPGATLATWTVAGGVRSALADAGFQVQKREGFGRKREMLVGTREPGRDAAAAGEPGSYAAAGEPGSYAAAGEPGSYAAAPRERRAVVVGFGLAGTIASERLASRGWEVALVDAQEARSSAAVGLVRPIVNLRDAVNAKISRSAFLYALQHFRGLAAEGHAIDWAACGALQLAADPDEEQRFEAIAAAQEFPPEFLAFANPAQARAIAGRQVAHAGWWMPSGSWVSPPSLVAASLARSGARVAKRFGQKVERIEREGASWRALNAENRVIAEAPVLVLANAVDAKRLAPEARLPLSLVRGQVSYLPGDPARALRCIVSGNGYVAPLPAGGHCAGATYRHDDPDESVRLDEHRENCARAESMLPGFTAGVDPRSLAGWTGFRATVPDRLPIFGASATPGLCVATGLGSRGLLWAPLAAEMLACALEGEPAPLPRDFTGALSPLRFLS